MRNWLDNHEISILSSAERSGARIEGCELVKIRRVRRTLRYDLRSATVYSGCS
jgi:hypothetical protein